MKPKLILPLYFLVVLLIVLLFNCKKDRVKVTPEVKIVPVTNITAISATSGGMVNDDGGAPVTDRGVCWSTAKEPTTKDSKTSDGNGNGNYTSTITELLPGTNYTIIAYATNEVGTGYSSQLSFTTLALAPVVTTTALTSVTATSAISGGNITNDGGSLIVERGICWSTNLSPTISDSKTSDATGLGIFISEAKGLTPGLTYFFRAYATNSVGTAYGNQVSTTTNAVLPTITTTATSDITSSSARSGGNITNNGGAGITSSGVCWSTNPTPTISDSKTTDGTVTGVFMSALSGLVAGATYYIRAYATNSIGTAYGNQVTLTISAVLPTISTTAAFNVTSSSALSGGNITNNGGATITSSGICWSTSENPTISNSKSSDGTLTGVYASSMSGLVPGTTYYIRSYATNNIGTAYGNQVTLTISAVLPTISTTAASNVTSSSALSGGNITNNGGATISSSGVCWSTTTNPTIGNSKSSEVTLTGVFTSSLSGLIPGEVYYIRAYATNSIGTAYGNEISFTTTAPSLYNNSEWIIDKNNEYQIIGLHTNGSKLGIQTNPLNSSELIAIYQKTPASPSIYIKLDSELLPRQIYMDGNILLLDNFTPTTVDIAIIRPSNSIEILRKISSPDLASLKKFKKSGLMDFDIFSPKSLAYAGFGIKTAICIIDIALIYASAGTFGPFLITKTALDCGSSLIGLITINFNQELETDKIYQSSLYAGQALNAIGCTMLKPLSCLSYVIGEIKELKKEADNRLQISNEYLKKAAEAFSYNSSLPIVVTIPVGTNKTGTSAISGISVLDNGGLNITTKGICWSTLPSPTINNNKTIGSAGNSTEQFSMNNLTPATKYYVRAYATNSQGTAYGNQEEFVTMGWILIQEEIPLSGHETCTYIGDDGKSHSYETYGQKSISLKGEIVVGLDKTTLTITEQKYPDMTFTSSIPIECKLQINGNSVMLSYYYAENGRGSLKYDIIGQMNAEKTEINGIGTYSEIFSPLDGCTGFTNTGSGKCKILIPH